MKKALSTFAFLFFVGCGVGAEDVNQSVEPAPTGVSEQALMQKCPYYAPKCCGVQRPPLCQGNCVAQSAPCP